MRGDALPRNLGCLVNAAISIVRLRGRFRRLPLAQRHYAAWQDEAGPARDRPPRLTHTAHTKQAPTEGRSSIRWPTANGAPNRAERTSSCAAQATQQGHPRPCPTPFTQPCWPTPSDLCEYKIARAEPGQSLDNTMQAH